MLFNVPIVNTSMISSSNSKLNVPIQAPLKKILQLSNTIVAYLKIG